jgi:hypothetical protein
MKSTREILEELGFKKDGPREAQEAFLKHLLHAAGIKPLKTQENIKTDSLKVGEQLTFNFEHIQKSS